MALIAGSRKECLPHRSLRAEATPPPPAPVMERGGCKESVLPLWERLAA